MATNGYRKMIDEGAELDKQIKQGTKRLKEIKKSLKERAQGVGTKELEGHLYKIVFTDSSERVVKTDEVVAALFNLTAEEIRSSDANDVVTVTYGMFQQLLKVATFKINDLKKVLTGDELDAFTEKIEKPYYRSTFKKI